MGDPQCKVAVVCGKDQSFTIAIQSSHGFQVPVRRQQVAQQGTFALVFPGTQNTTRLVYRHVMMTKGLNMAAVHGHHVGFWVDLDPLPSDALAVYLHAAFPMIVSLARREAIPA